VAGTEGSRIAQAEAQAQPDTGRGGAGSPAPGGASPGRYAGFVATGLGLSLVLFSALVAGLNRFYFEVLATVLVVGGVFRGPIALFAVYPGRWVFGRIRGAIRGGPRRNLVGTVMVCMAVAGVSELGAICVAWMLFVADKSLSDFVQGLLVLFGVGACGAVASGLMFYGRGDRRDA